MPRCLSFETLLVKELAPQRDVVKLILLSPWHYVWIHGCLKFLAWSSATALTSVGEMERALKLMDLLQTAFGYLPELLLQQSSRSLSWTHISAGALAKETRLLRTFQEPQLKRRGVSKNKHEKTIKLTLESRGYFFLSKHSLTKASIWVFFKSLKRNFISSISYFFEKDVACA